jgi:hypothetical protein
MPTYRIKKVSIAKLVFLVDAASEEEAIEKAKTDDYDFYQKHVGETVISCKKTKLTKDTLHEHSKARGYF